MIDEAHAPTEREEIEMLVPWYVTGRISAADARRVEAFVARNPDFARHIAVARDERSAAVEVSEAQGMPSARATDRLFEAIRAEPMPRSVAARRQANGLLARVRGFFENPTPVTVRYAAMAAAAVVLVQAAVLGSMFATQPAGDGGGYRTAAGPETSAAAVALVSFADGASLAEITSLLDGVGGRIVDGPLKGGFYKVAIAAANGDGDSGAARAMEALRKKSGVVKLVLPSR
ncbi:MAG: hypothetical protein KDJ37_12830 [Hyphomicrobiaceae bacterium]|nr:hypothetical protein [Hyphomicrobiaceae bacterium]